MAKHSEWFIIVDKETGYAANIAPWSSGNMERTGRICEEFRDVHHPGCEVIKVVRADSKGES